MRSVVSRIILCAVICASCVAGRAFAADGDLRQMSKEERDARMGWWREARFGMFIHWGLYSVLGGEYKGQDYGKEMGGASAEWIMSSAGMSREEYAELAKEFNPVKFDADAWASLAQEAGMKYVVITAKHHDGFSMFDTAMTDFDIVDATPFKRDVIKELSEACKRHGLRFGVYYSHSRDWHNRRNVRTDQDPPPPEYVDFVKGQLRELLTNYGDMAIIWFDTGDQYADINTSYGELVQQLQPETLISGRLKGREGMSDYKQEGDRSIPSKRSEGDAETPMTMRDNWGYDRDEDNWKSPEDLIQRLSLTVCRGANMLLNVGPKPDGTLTQEDTERLKAIGGWMKVNGEAVYGTQASPFDYDFDWGSITQKPETLYLHVLRWDPSGVAFDGLKTRVKKAYLLADADQKALAVTQDTDAGTLRAALPGQAPGPYDNVVVLKLDGPVATNPAAKGTYHWVKGTDIKLDPSAKPRQSR